MKITIKKILYVALLTLLLHSCDGIQTFNTDPCEPGTVRKGNACVEEEARVEITGGFLKINGMVNCRDPDLNKLHKSELVTLCDGSVAQGKLALSSEIPVCTKDGEQDCISKSNFKAVDTENVSSSDIKNGKVVAGVSGSYRGAKLCRNYSALTTIDVSYTPSNLRWNFVTFLPAAVDTGTDQITFTDLHGLITNSPLRFSTTTTLPSPLVAGTTYYAIFVSTTVIQLASTPNGTAIDLTTQGAGTHTAHDVADNVAQYFDTIDDDNNGFANSPTDNPWGSADYLCDSSNFINVTSSSAPLLPSGLTPPTGNRAFTQIWQDKISGIYFSNILYVSGGTRHWSDAVRTCESLNGGTAGEGWILPSQKELMQLYVHGISKVVLAGGSTAAHFWTSTAASNFTHYVWIVSLASGYTDGNFIRYHNSVSTICTRY